MTHETKKKPTFYVVLKHVHRPRNKKKTYDADYMKNPENFQVDELFNIVTKIRTNDLQVYHVILDLNNKKVVKNSYDRRSYSELMSYLTTHYAAQFTGMLRDYIEEVKEVGAAIAEKPAEAINS